MKQTRPMQFVFRSFAALAVGIGSLAFAGPIEPAADGLIDLPHLKDPALEVVQTPRTFDPRLQSLWLAALERDDATLQQEAIEAFIEAHSDGMEISPAVRDAVRGFVGDSYVLDVRLSAARALHAFNERDGAAILAMNQSQVHPYVSPVLDRILADWDVAEARELWRSRVSDSAQSRTVRESAVRALAVVGDGEAVDALIALVLDDGEAASLRLVAAEAAGQLASEGFNERAKELSLKSTLGALLAVRLLDSHEDAAAIDRLLTLTRHEAPAVAAAAARRLVVFVPDKLPRELMAHADPDVRLSVTKALAEAPVEVSVELLGQALDDSSEQVRSLARDTLIAWAQADTLRAAIESRIEQAWSQAGWRGREQSALVAAWINDPSMASLFVKGLRDDRPRVRLAACTALRHLQVAETTSAMVARLKELDAQLRNKELADTHQDIGHEAVQLITALGMLEAREIDPLLKTMIPKHSLPSVEARAAAIWTLGKWYEGTSDAALANQWIARMSDETPLDPEAMAVRVASAIALGRAGGEQAVPSLNQFANPPGGSDNELAAACRWSLEQITGTPQPDPQPKAALYTGWFIEPVN